MKRFSLLTVILALAILVSACAPQAEPTAVPTNTPAPAPTNTPVPASPTPEAQDIVTIAVEDGRFTTLAAALEAAGLAETLQGPGPFTVFAPTDEAFAKLPEGTVEALLQDIPALTDILLYHVVEGNVLAADVASLESADTLAGKPVAIDAGMGKVMINDAEVIIADIQASNGVIHVIDTVLLPPAEKTIVDAAVEDGRFTTLVAALEAAGLAETLKGEGPFTVFAPTDEAFARLPEGTVENLLLPENKDQLTDILTYHVVSGKVLSSDVIQLGSADTLLGQPVTISMDGDTVKINDAQVVITDIVTANGVIHVIDAVLIPGE